MSISLIPDCTKTEIKRASNITLMSLLNLTFLPLISFLWLLIQLNKNHTDWLTTYYLKFSIKLNLNAALALGVVTGFMIVIGGFNSAWTWVYVISYFTLVHTLFILLAVWAMTRSWSGKRLKTD
ncbi:MAG: hypothetical protein HRT52_07920 [Colwellia sp.]|nr:hypothetical protein [Colwellia sp.]